MSPEKVQPEKKKSLLWLLVAALMVVGAGIWLWRRQSNSAAAKPDAAKAAANRVIPVVTAQVAQQDVPIYLDGLGSVIAFNTVTVRSQVDGRLDKVFFREGQVVHRGEVLAQIDQRPFEIQLHQAQGALARDGALLKGSKLNLQRYADLSSRKLIAQQQADDQAASVGQAEGAVRVDEAAIETARLNLDYSRITSPIDGVTGVRLVDQGNIVHASDATGIVVLTQLDPISVLFTLPEDVLPQVAQQMQSGTLPVEAWSRDGSTRLGTGKLLLIDNLINQATGTLRLKAVFANPKRILWPNQFVKARLLLTTRRNALVVPSSVVQRGPDGTFAYVVQKDQTVQPKQVEVELAQGDSTLISKGLEAGELVVVDGQNQLRPGAKVQARQQGAAGGGQPAVPAGRANGVERGAAR